MIPSEKSHLRAAASSHPGMSGKENEDRYAIAAFRLEDKTATPVVFAIVADGIGGHQAGEVAAEIAVETISRNVAASDGGQPQQTLYQAINLANQAIFAEAQANPGKAGMGATCACCWVIGNQLYTASLGDSRIYLLRKESIQQISIDHTWIQAALQAGLITPDQVKGHPQAHIIRRYLGSQNTVEPDIRLRLSIYETDEQAQANQGLTLLPGDQLLICSDGLTDLVEDGEILDTLINPDPETNITNLINLANQRGGHDNITLINLTYPAAPQESITQPRPDAKKRRRIPWAATCVILLLLLVLTLLAAYWLIMRPDIPPTLAPPTSSTPATLAAQFF